MESTDQAGRKRKYHGERGLEEEQPPGRATASTKQEDSGSGIIKTMVTDLATGVVGSLISKLGELLQKEYNLQKDLPDKITSLIKELERAQAALHEVAEVPPDQLNEQVRIWAREVREASYDMEDVLDTFHDDHSHEPCNNQGFFKRLQDKLIGLFKRRKIATTLEAIYTELNNIAQSYRRYTVDITNVSRPTARTTIDPRLEAMYKQVTQLVGIDKPKRDLISMLSLAPQGDMDESKKKMKVVSVCGAGGLGKTTLAKAVYDGLKVEFDCTAFVPVGRKPDLPKVFRDILIDLDEEFMKPKYATLDGKQLIDVMRAYLTNKRYFIIIDDVWEMETWERIKLAMYENNNGSRLITTTRIWNVAAESGEVYKHEPLPRDQSEKLFYTRIFGANGTCPDQLKEVSEKILNKCGGVPLAIITMASLLVGKRQGEWTEVCESDVFGDKKKNRQVTDTEWILSLSYYDLPPHLKTCLLYISAFPEDYVIPKDTLIWMWVTEGFVHDEPGTRLFEVGEGYFNELINRSMIQAVRSHEDVSFIVGCQIHDMVLDLLCVKSQEENFFIIASNINVKSTSSLCKVRRLSYQKTMVELSHKDTAHVRTCFAFMDRGGTVDVGFLSQSFKLLRSLALEGCNLSEVVPENFLHLRYLRLSHMKATLSKDIGALKFLQTLDLVDFDIEELPLSVGLLTQLICLRVNQDTKVPNGIIKKMTSLEELQIPFQGNGVKDLDNLCELRVLNIVILDDNNTKTMQSDFVNTVGNLHKLQRLTLQTEDEDSNDDIWNAAVLPQSLQYLVLGVEYDTAFEVLPSCINPSNLPNLTHLELTVEHMDGQSLTSLGELPELRHLKLTIHSHTCKMTIEVTVNGWFEKLVSLSLLFSSVQFELNEDSSVTFTIWGGGGLGIDNYKEETQCIVHAPSVMPNLQQLDFCVKVDSNASCDRLGLEYLRSLQKVKLYVFDEDVDKEALKRTIEAHPNRPTLELSDL